MEINAGVLSIVYEKCLDKFIGLTESKALRDNPLKKKWVFSGQAEGRFEKISYLENTSASVRFHQLTQELINEKLKQRGEKSQQSILKSMNESSRYNSYWGKWVGDYIVGPHYKVEFNRLYVPEQLTTMASDFILMNLIDQASVRNSKYRMESLGFLGTVIAERWFILPLPFENVFLYRLLESAIGAQWELIKRTTPKLRKELVDEAKKTYWKDILEFYDDLSVKQFAFLSGKVKSQEFHRMVKLLRRVDPFFDQAPYQKHDLHYVLLAGGTLKDSKRKLLIHKIRELRSKRIISRQEGQYLLKGFQSNKHNYLASEVGILDEWKRHYDRWDIFTAMAFHDTIKLMALKNKKVSLRKFRLQQVEELNFWHGLSRAEEDKETYIEEMKNVMKVTYHDLMKDHYTRPNVIAFKSLRTAGIVGLLYLLLSSDDQELVAASEESPALSLPKDFQLIVGILDLLDIIQDNEEDFEETQEFLHDKLLKVLENYEQYSAKDQEKVKKLIIDLKPQDEDVLEEIKRIDPSLVEKL